MTLVFRSDEEMKARDPLLYEQMVGQYLSEDEVKELVDKSDLRLSNILIKHMDIVQNNIVYDLQKQVEVSETCLFLGSRLRKHGARAESRNKSK